MGGGDYGPAVDVWAIGEEEHEHSRAANTVLGLIGVAPWWLLFPRLPVG